MFAARKVYPKWQTDCVNSEPLRSLHFARKKEKIKSKLPRHFLLLYCPQSSFADAPRVTPSFNMTNGSRLNFRHFSRYVGKYGKTPVTYFMRTIKIDPWRRRGSLVFLFVLSMRPPIDGSSTRSRNYNAQTERLKSTVFPGP